MNQYSEFENLVKRLASERVALHPDGTFWNAICLDNGKIIAVGLTPNEAAENALTLKRLKPQE